MLTQHRIRAVIWDLDGVILRRPAGSGTFQVSSNTAIRRQSLAEYQVDHTLLGFITAMRRSVQTGLLVNSWAEVWEVVDLKDALTPAFDRIIQAVDSGLHRPDARIFAMAALRMGIAPQEAVLVDASPQHTAAARQAGLQAFTFENPAQIGSELMGLLVETVN